MGRVSVVQFVHSLHLSKSDEAVLIQHIEDCHIEASGPGLHDRCTDKVRRFLEFKPPPEELSWKARIKLEDALNAGFTSKEAYQMGIPAIGVVAVLVASVAFTAWIQAPGGGSPSWAGCPYPLFTAFLIVNGFAFMLALASVIVVTAFPLVLNRTPHQAAWWGGVLLIISLLAFIVAFLLAGFVTVGYLSPPPTCSSLSCTNGGIPCNLNYYIYGSGGDGDDDDDGLLLFQMDPNAAALTLKTNSSIGVCVRYDTAVPHEDDDGDVYTTLHPWVPNDDDDYDASLQQLLTDPLTQNKTLCMDVTNLLAVLGPNVDPKTLAVNLTGANITDLNAYVAAYDHLYNSFNASIAAVQQLWAYPDLPYFCLPNNTASIMKFSTLCDRTPNTVSALGSSTSVSNTGSYIMASTSASVGAVIFSNDTTAQQVSMAIKTLAGVFALILVIIVIFLVKSKWL